MKTLAILALMVLAGASHADELYNNGPVVNGFGCSVLMPPATTLGFGDQTSSANSVAEDFTVTGTGWTISDIDFFGYQTGAKSFGFQDVTWSIVSGDVNTGAVVASGVTSVTDGGRVGYRVTTTTRRNRDRGIYDIKADIDDVMLGAGTYWLTWSLTGSSSFSVYVYTYTKTHLAMRPLFRLFLCSHRSRLLLRLMFHPHNSQPVNAQYL